MTRMPRLWTSVPDSVRLAVEQLAREANLPVSLYLRKLISDSSLVKERARVFEETDMEDQKHAKEKHSREGGVQPNGRRGTSGRGL